MIHHAEGPIIPETPFSNKMYLREVLNRCNEYIHWLDRYFSILGLDFLVKTYTGKVKTIKILTSTSTGNSSKLEDLRKGV